MRTAIVIMFFFSELCIAPSVASAAPEFSDIGCQEADDINNCTRVTVNAIRTKNKCEVSFTVKSQELRNWKGQAGPLGADFEKSIPLVRHDEHTANCCKSLLDDENSYATTPQWGNPRGVWNAVCQQVLPQRVDVAQLALADTYTYVCTDHGKSYPLKVDEKKNTIEWKGSIYNIKPQEGCAKFGWRAERDGASFDFCTATQGYAEFEQSGTRIQCNMRAWLGVRVQNVDNAIAESLGGSQISTSTMPPWMAQLFAKEADYDALTKAFYSLPLKGRQCPGHYYANQGADSCLDSQESLSNYRGDVLVVVRSFPAWKEAGGDKILAEYKSTQEKAKLEQEKSQESEIAHKKEQAQLKEADHAAREREVMNNTPDCRSMIELSKSLKVIEKQQKDAGEQIMRGAVDEETCSTLSEAERRLTEYMNMQVSCFMSMKDSISYLRLPRNSDNLDLIVNITKGSIDQIHNVGRGQCWRK